MPLYDATPKQLAEVGLKPKDAQRLFRALCTLADYESEITNALANCRSVYSSEVSRVCEALRYLVDGTGREDKD